MMAGVGREGGGGRTVGQSHDQLRLSQRQLEAAPADRRVRAERGDLVSVHVLHANVADAVGRRMTHDPDAPGTELRASCDSNRVRRRSSIRVGNSRTAFIDGAHCGAGSLSIAFHLVSSSQSPPNVTGCALTTSTRHVNVEAMTTNPTVVATGRCGLVQRMERYLDTVEKDGKVFGPREIDLLCRALGYLEMGYSQASEVAMLQVEPADLYCSKGRNGPPRTMADRCRGSSQNGASAAGRVK